MEVKEGRLAVTQPLYLSTMRSLGLFSRQVSFSCVFVFAAVRVQEFVVSLLDIPSI